MRKLLTKTLQRMEKYCYSNACDDVFDVGIYVPGTAASAGSTQTFGFETRVCGVAAATAALSSVTPGPWPGHQKYVY